MGNSFVSLLIDVNVARDLVALYVLFFFFFFFWKWASFNQSKG